MQVQDLCVICQISMKRGAVLRILPCRHLLHVRCSEPIIESGVCAICRGEITGNKLCNKVHNILLKK